MNKVVLVGDDQVGKTTFAHIACMHSVPLNLYRSTDNESYFLHGEHNSTELVVVYSRVTNTQLVNIVAGAEGIIVLYDVDIYSAKRWLRRLANCMQGVYKVPVLICKHKSAQSHGRHDRRLSETLAQYHNAEHTHTSKDRATGIQDCMNRVITKIRRNLPSPLAKHAHDDR